MESTRCVLISTYELGRQPFGLASPAAWLRRAGARVTCLDLSREPLREEPVRQADLIAFYVPMHTATRLAVEVLPAVRKLIDYLREVNSCPEMQIMCCGGIYKRAEGLAEEIGADLYAPDAAAAVQVANENPEKKATLEQQTVGRTRRIRKAAARKNAKVTRQKQDTPYNEAA